MWPAGTASYLGSCAVGGGHVLNARRLPDGSGLCKKHADMWFDYTPKVGDEVQCFRRVVDVASAGYRPTLIVRRIEEDGSVVVVRLGFPGVEYTLREGEAIRKDATDVYRNPRVRGCACA